jgi:AmmeMemoRadiSam system protein A
MKNEKYTYGEKRWLLSLARDSIFHYLKKGSELSELSDTLPKSLTEEKGSFVTLMLDNKLRGCIGHILPVQPLFKDIMENAISAAFSDPRFFPLTEDEYSKIEIEISALSIPNKLVYKDSDDLIKRLKPEVDGVIVEKNGYSATFLPQVWEQIRDSEDFLSHLCLKAGLNPYEWKVGDLDVQIYSVESFDEKQFAELLG